MSVNERMTKVWVGLPNHWSSGGEAMWAVALGNDLYELRNVPFQAYGLNLGDIVRATADDDGQAPEIREVVRPSGHQTLRVYFETTLAEERRLELLQSLAPLAVSFERATETFFALDLAPTADIVSVQAELDMWEEQKWAVYETCDPRMPGSFDDFPEDDGWVH